MSHEDTTSDTQEPITTPPAAASVDPSLSTEQSTGLMGRFLGSIGLATFIRPRVVDDTYQEQMTAPDGTESIIPDESITQSRADVRRARKEEQKATKDAERREQTQATARAYFNQFVHWTQKSNIILDESEKKVRPGVAQPLRKEVVRTGIRPVVDQIRELSHGHEVSASVHDAMRTVARIEHNSERWLTHLREEGTLWGVPVKKLDATHVRLIGERINSMMHQLTAWKSTYPAAVEGKVDISALKTPTERSIGEQAIKIKQQMDYEKAVLAVLAGEKYYTAEQGMMLKAIYDQLQAEKVRIVGQNMVRATADQAQEAATAITNRYEAYFDRPWLTATIHALNDKVRNAASSSTTILNPHERRILKDNIISNTLDELLLKEFGNDPTIWTAQMRGDAAALKLALAEILRANVS